MLYFPQGGGIIFSKIVPAVGFMSAEREFAFHFNNSMAQTGIYMALTQLLGQAEQAPVILCIGSDLAVGDSLGPVAGTMLVRRKFPGYVYGTLRSPVTAKETKYLAEFLRRTHPGRPVIAVDAAVGEEEDVGLIKVMRGALRPGAGANKRLPKVGDISVLGIVAKKSPAVYPLFHLTRLGTVYAMAETISAAIADFVEDKSVIFSQKCV